MTLISLIAVQRVIHCPHMQDRTMLVFLSVIKTAINAPRIDLIGRVSCLKYSHTKVFSAKAWTSMCRNIIEVQVLTSPHDHQITSSL